MFKTVGLSKFNDKTPFVVLKLFYCIRTWKLNLWWIFKVSVQSGKRGFGLSVNRVTRCTNMVHTVVNVLG